LPSFNNKKQLRYVLTLGTTTFQNGKNQIIFDGFRSTTEISNAGFMQSGEAKVRIYGVKSSDMDSVTTLAWRNNSLLKNTLEIYAIDGSEETLIFVGNVVNAWGDYQGMPDVFLHIQAYSAYYERIRPVPPRSLVGEFDVATVMAQIARDMGMKFENNGVKVKMSDMYLSNTNLMQAKELAHAAGVNMYIENDIVAITPAFVARGSQAAIVSASTGMVGYPTFDGVGINVRTLFNPAILYGGAIQLETDLMHARGDWIVAGINHILESEKPDGQWFSQIRGVVSEITIARR